MTSIYDIVYDYIDRFFPGQKVNKETKIAIHREVKKLLRKGWCSNEILLRFRQIQRNQKPGVKYDTNVSYFFRGLRPKEINLLDPDKFYYHNALRVTCKPPKRELDIDAGEVIRINEPYFLEMKASFSLGELISYYARQFNIDIHKQEWNRYEGAFRWLLNAYDIEIILFMIDVAANMCHAEDLRLPSTPMQIRDYHREAVQVRNEKKTEAVIAGGNKIVVRKRTRTS